MDPSPAIPAWKPLGTADLLAAWDRSRAGHPWQRAVVLLGDLARWDEASAHPVGPSSWPEPVS